MKRYYENGNIVPIAKGNLQSAFPKSPDEQRMRDSSVYPVLRVGQFEMQRIAKESLEKKEQKERVDVLNWLSGLSFDIS